MESNSSQTSSIFSYNPLFSSTITLCILIFLYFPCNNSLKLIVSPILISTLVLLLSLLRLGISQQTLQQQQQQQKSHANIVQPEPESEHKPKPEPELECENENKSEFEPKPKPEPRPQPQPQPESVNENENDENEPEPEPEPEPGLKLDPNPEPELEPEPELNKTSLTLGIQTSIELKPEPSLKRDLSQEEEKVGTQCDRAEIQPIKHCGLEPESKQIIDTDIIIKEDKQRQPDPAIDPFLYSTETFVGWAVCAPLEVIYESYEGEEDLDMYAESGSDTDTDTGSSFTWEEEEKEGMFEIALDHGYGDYNNKNAVLDMKKLKNEFEVDEEDNLIEIDISF